MEHPPPDCESRSRAASASAPTPPSPNPCLATVLGRFPARREFVVPLLQAVQAEIGYVSVEAMRAIAAWVRVPEAAVQGIATFYAQFRFSKPGRHCVTVCRGTACHVRGSGRIVEDVDLSFNVKPGRTSPDGMFSLETVACVGACALAPVVLLDHKVYRHQSPASVRKLLRDVEPAAPQAGHPEASDGHVDG